MTSAGQSQDAQPARPSTRMAILEVARLEISEHGFDGVSIRSIARRAGVDPRLVRHYFGSKERLLLHAVQVEESGPIQLAQQLTRGSRGSIGQRTAKALLEHWDNPRTAAPYQARLAASLTNAEVARLMREEFVSVFFGALAQQYSPDRADLRAALAASQLVGLAMSRHLIEEPVLAGCPQQDLTRLMGRAIQHYLTADLAHAGTGSTRSTRRRGADAGDTGRAGAGPSPAA